MHIRVQIYLSLPLLGPLLIFGVALVNTFVSKLGRARTDHLRRLHCMR